MHSKNFKGQAYRIKYIGDTDTLYSKEVIIDYDLEYEALQIHKKWKSEEEFWNYEYNYRSSMASALHRHARIACMIPGANKDKSELTDEQSEAMAVLEHRRWNAYIRSEGYVYSGSESADSRNDLAKTHNNLVAYDRLDDETKNKDRKISADKKEMSQ